MKKNLLLYLFICSYSLNFAQEEIVTTVEYNFLNFHSYGRKPKSTLRFNKSKSIFEYNKYEGGQRVSTKENVEGMAMLTIYDNTDEIGTYQYIDFDKYKIYERRMNGLGKKSKRYVYLEDSLVIPTWVLIDSTKNINKYTCKLAKTKFWGRIYYAWYTPDIPASKGPWKLHGLPGLILYAYDDVNKVSWTVEKITFQDTYTFPQIKKKTKTLTLHEFLSQEHENQKKLLKYINTSNSEDEGIVKVTIKGEKLEKLDE